MYFENNRLIVTKLIDNGENIVILFNKLDKIV